MTAAILSVSLITMSCTIYALYKYRTISIQKDKNEKVIVEQLNLISDSVVALYTTYLEDKRNNIVMLIRKLETEERYEECAKLRNEVINIDNFIKDMNNR